LAYLERLLDRYFICEALEIRKHVLGGVPGHHNKVANHGLLEDVPPLGLEAGPLPK